MPNKHKIFGTKFDNILNSKNKIAILGLLGFDSGQK